MNNPRVALDRLFHIDSIISMASGVIGIVVPHFVIAHFVGEYNHNVHEALRYTSMHATKLFNATNSIFIS